MRNRIAFAVALIAAVLSAPAAAGDAKGTVVYKGRTADLKFAYLVKGPDAVTKQPIRRLILSTKDMGAKIAACAKMVDVLQQDRPVLLASHRVRPPYTAAAPSRGPA